jgi:hypothetical protein
MDPDLLLTLVAGLSQLAMAVMGVWLGLRPPEKEHHWRTVTIFTVVGIIGLGAIVWTGVRAQRSQSEQSGRVVSAITTVETGQTRIAGQLDRLGQRLTLPQANPRATNPAVVERTAVTPEQHARIVVSRIETVVAEPVITPGDMGVRVWYANKGNLFGYSPTITAYMQISDPITQTDIDKEMTKVRDLAFAHTPVRNTEMNVGDEAFRPFWRISAADWQAMLQGKKQMYTYVVLTYADDTLPKNKYWVQEFAMVQSQDASVYDVVRQKTYLHIKAH